VLPIKSCADCENRYREMIFRVNETLYSARKLLVSVPKLEINYASRLIFAANTSRADLFATSTLRVDFDNLEVVWRDLRPTAKLQLQGGGYAMKTGGSAYQFHAMGRAGGGCSHLREQRRDET